VINYFPAKILMQAQSGMPGSWMCFEQTSKFLELFLRNSAFRSFCSEVIFLSRRYFAADFLGPAATGVSCCTLLGACQVATLTHSYVLCKMRNAIFYNDLLLKHRIINPYFMELHDKESSLERYSVS
jgi:hypothetical protein